MRESATHPIGGLISPGHGVDTWEAGMISLSTFMTQAKPTRLMRAISLDVSCHRNRMAWVTSSLLAFTLLAASGQNQN